jgi:RNA polymerase primary sigma factor
MGVRKGGRREARTTGAGAIPEAPGIKAERRQNLNSKKINDELREKISGALSLLPERERKVLEMRFGINGCAPSTFREIGLYFNVTLERIRQIEARALRRLSNHERSGKLNNDLNH